MEISFESHPPFFPEIFKTLLRSRKIFFQETEGFLILGARFHVILDYLHCCWNCTIHSAEG